MNDDERHKALMRARFVKRVVVSLLERREADDDTISTSFQRAITNLESLENLLSLRKVGIFGRLSSGKSSFLNNLLQFDEVFRTGNGPTSAVPTEIRRSSDGKYRATVEFYSIADVKRDLYFYLSTGGDEEDKEESPERIAVFNRLQVLFDLEDIESMESLLDHSESMLVPRRLTPQPVTPMLGQPACDYVDFVGREPLVLEAGSGEELLDWIRPFIFLDVENDKFLPFTVNYVTIEGPYERLPYGIALVDTPGLGDSECVLSSQRALDLLPAMDEVWLVTNPKEALGHNEDRGVILKAMLSNNSSSAISIVATNADTVKESELPDIKERMLKSLRSTLARRRTAGACTKARTIKPFEYLDEDERAEVLAEVQNIKIGFTGIPPCEEKAPFGFEFWADMLNEAGAKQAVEAAEGARLLATIEMNLAGVGLERRPFLGGDEAHELQRSADYACDVMKDVERGLTQYFDEHSLYDDISRTGRWVNQPRMKRLHGNTINTLMSVHKNGVMLSRGEIRPGFIDVSEDISQQWNIRVYRNFVPVLDDAVRNFREQLRQLPATPEVRAQIDLVSNNIRQLKRRVKRECFHGNLPSNVRQCLISKHVFQRGSKGLCMPSASQVDETIRDAPLASAQRGLNSLIRAIMTTVPTLTEHLILVDNFPEEVRAPLREALAYRGPCEELPPSQMVSIFSEERMRNPVMLPCGHVFDSADMETLFERHGGDIQCPFCNFEVNHRESLVNRLDLQTLPLPAYHADEVEDVARWTSAVWQSLRAEALRTRFEEEVEPEEEWSEDDEKA